jgi:hypothetical protein
MEIIRENDVRTDEHTFANYCRRVDLSTVLNLRSLADIDVLIDETTLPNYYIVTDGGAGANLHVMPHLYS